VAHVFSNTKTQRDRVYKKSSEQVSREIVNGMTDAEYKSTDALANLECYPEVAHELSLAIVQILQEEGVR
jgi:hypothetical protein